MISFANVLNFLNPFSPKGLIKSADDWVKRWQVRYPQMRNPQPAAFCKPVFSAEENFRPLAAGSGGEPYSEYENLRWTVTEAASLYYVSGARLLGREGAVISPDNRVFAEFTMPPARLWSEHSCFKRRRIPNVIQLKGWYATIAWPESEFFFHWMMESLPRMALLREYVSILDGVFVSGRVQRFHIDALAVLGVPENKLIELQPGSHFQPEHLFVPRAFAMYNPPRWCVAWYQSVYLSDGTVATGGSASRKRIYISRADAPARRIANEDEVIAMLEMRGFVSVQLSSLSFLEQARVFAEADIVVAPHGAGLSNIVFCRPGTHVVEIMPPRWMAPCFMSLAAVANCDYRYVVADELADGVTSSPQRANIVVPVVALEKMMCDLFACNQTKPS